jgi:hypothetical protein
MRRATLLLALIGCSGGNAPGSYAEQSTADGDANYYREDKAAESAPATSKTSPRKMKKEAMPEEEGMMGGLAAPVMAASPPSPPGERAAGDDEADGWADDGPADVAPERAWFPETFLFAPRVVTDAEGNATVPVTVPDRLTQWRVLGLAHDRSGGMTGAVHSFAGTLPVYVDPVAPPFLSTGDTVRLPIQVVNTTDAAVQERLVLSAQGAALLDAPTTVSVPARGSVTVWATVRAAAAGQASVRVVLGSTDAVTRTFEVLPTGRRVEQVRSGTLAASRSFDVLGAADLDPASARVQLVVHPGALAMLRNELATASSRGGVAGAGYALMLGARGAQLLTDLGLDVTEEGPAGPARTAGENLRTLALRAGQQALRHSRSPNTAAAILLAGPALQDTRNAAVHRLGERLRQQLVDGQRPDGAWAVSAGPRTIQQELVTTAAATRALADIAALPCDDATLAARRGRDAALATVRAAGVFERHAAAVTDPYTAAMLLASGAMEGEEAALLRTKIVDSVTQQPDGSLVLRVGAGVRRFDGGTPTTAEATALAAQVLLASGPADVVADLGAGLLAAWRPGVGWGDGHADLEGLRALTVLFQEPLPDPVTIRLTRDGQAVAEKTLSGDALKDLSVLGAPAGAARGPHTWGVEATPAVPGMGFAFTLETWVPWTAAPGPAGLDLTVRLPEAPRVGHPDDLIVAVAAPAGTALSLDLPLPPGVEVDAKALHALGASGVLTSWESEDGLLILNIPALTAGATFSAEVPIVPTFAGRFKTGPARLTAASAPDTPRVAAPGAWTILPAPGHY